VLQELQLTHLHHQQPLTPLGRHSHLLLPLVLQDQRQVGTQACSAWAAPAAKAIKAGAG